MSEVDITHLLRAETWELAASNATHGSDFAPKAWANSLEQAQTLLPDVDLDAGREHFKGYGAWTYEELDDATVHGLLLQEAVLELREAGIEGMDPDTLFDDIEWWQDYKRDCKDGKFSGRIYRGDNDRLYYYYGD